MLRKTFLWTTILCLAALLLSGFAVAQEVKGADTDNVGDPNFRLGGEDGICSSPNAPIPDNTPDVGVTDTLSIQCPQGPVTDLEVLVQVSHTWVGDLEVTLTKVGGTSAVILDRPGLAPPLPPPGSCCGCSGNDIDAIFSDAGDHSAEAQCLNSPAINGIAVAGDPSDNTLMATFNGEDLCGDWTLRVTDGAAADLGTLNTWCLLAGAGDGDGEPPVPASSRTGIMLLIGLLLAGSTYYMIKRRQTV